MNQKISHAQWTRREIEVLISLFNKKMTNAQIAVELNRSPSSVEKKLSRIGFKNRYSNGYFSEIYSAEFCATVYEFYKIYGLKETSTKFSLARRQIEHIVRRHKKVNGIEKTKTGERHTDWKIDDVILMLTYIGLKPLDFISFKLGKSDSAIASYLKRRGFRLHYVNGLPLERFNELFQPQTEVTYMRTLEGKVFVPWVAIDSLDNDKQIKDYVSRKIITSMANLQRFIHGKKTNKETLDELWIKIEE